MRCPKCGFISFDHLENCLKCKKKIKKTSDGLSGTVYNVAPPVFLKLNEEPDQAENEIPDVFADADDALANEEIRDPDLDILIENEDEVDFSLSDEDSEDIELDLGGSEDEDIDFALQDEDEGDREITFDFEQFDEDQDAFASEAEMEPVQKTTGGMELPDELSDISDLEPPPVETPALEEVAEVAGDSEGEEFDLDLDFDLDLNEQEFAEPKVAVKSDDDDELLLGDIDLDEIPKEPEVKKKPASKGLDLNDDLSFDLDLGDLKLDED